MENRFKKIRNEYSEKRKDKNPKAKIYSVNEMCKEMNDNGFKVSAQKIKKIESEQYGVQIDAETLRAYKWKFDVSADWLIDETVTARKLDGDTAAASKVTGLSDDAIDEIKKLSVSEKHIIDAIFNKTVVSINLIKIIKEMLYYSHPITKNHTCITLDNGLTMRDKDYKELEHELNENEVIDILSYKLFFEMREIIEELSNDKQLSDEIKNEYEKKYFKPHKKLMYADELPKLTKDANGNPILGIENTIYNLETKIADRLKLRDSKNRTYDYGIEKLCNYSDFEKLMQIYRTKKSKEAYLEWLRFIEDETK